MENKNYNKFKNWSFKALGVNKNDDVTLLLQKNAIDGLMLLMKAKDEELYEHSVRISETAVIFGRHIGFSEEKVKDLYEAALLHDIGKLAIKDNILDKEGRLDSYEFDKIKMHPIQHHERVDGKGYPYGLVKNEIEISSKIITIADAHDALSSKRSYKKALKHNEVYIIMEEMSGKVFDENLLEKFFMMLESI
jgi:HD-GYP domain-containing protein (c-di-GMP phosphodiesterase class II)